MNNDECGPSGAKGAQWGGLGVRYCVFGESFFTCEAAFDTLAAHGHGVLAVAHCSEENVHLECPPDSRPGGDAGRKRKMDMWVSTSSWPTVRRTVKSSWWRPLDITVRRRVGHEDVETHM